MVMTPQPRFLGSLVWPCIAAAMLLLSTPVRGEEPAHFADPLAPFNETMFEFNRGFDSVAIRPLSTVWRKVVPKEVRSGVSNALANLQAPSEALNHLLQFNLEDAAITTARFAINSTIGIAGFVDVAESLDLTRQQTDFGLTLAHYGTGEGAYLVVPVLGPSTFRDFTGVAVDYFLNPASITNLVELKNLEWTGYYAVQAADTRLEYDAVLDELYYESDVGYARMQSYYLQNRRHQVQGGDVAGDALPDLDRYEEEDTPEGSDTHGN